MRSSNIVVVDQAKPPVLPYQPNFQLNTALGLLTGLFAGVGFVLVRDRFNRNIESPGISQTYLRLPELGSHSGGEAGLPASGVATGFH